MNTRIFVTLPESAPLPLRRRILSMGTLSFPGVLTALAVC